MALLLLFAPALPAGDGDPRADEVPLPAQSGERAIAEEALVVPLLVPDRIALVREGIEGFRLPRCGYDLDLGDVSRR